MALGVLALALGAYVYFFKGDFGRLSELRRLRPPGWRRRRYRLWIAKAAVLFAGPALIGLFLLGRGEALLAMPPEFEGLAQRAGAPAAPHLLALDVAAGLLGGGLLGSAWAWWRRRGGKPPAMLGDYAQLLPRERGEVLHAAASALTAGITEELYFRLLLPLSIALLTGSAALGFGIATLLFAYAHRYQRWVGMLATGIVGAVLAFLYLASGALWLAMLAHMLIDLNGLVLRPWIGGTFRA